MSDRNPTKPTPNDEKFKPQHVADGGRVKPSARRDANSPADTGGEGVNRGSEPDARRAGNGAR